MTKTAKTTKKDNSYNIKNIVSNNIFAVKILFGATPVLGIYVILAAVFQIVINFFEQTVCVYLVLNAIETKKSFGDVLPYLALILTLAIISTVFFNLYHHYAGYKFLPIVQQNLKMKLYNKAKEADISCYDNTEYYNNFVLTVAEADKAVERAQNLVTMVVQSITILICYGLFFISKDVTSVLFVIASFILRTIFSNILNKLNFKIRLQENVLERKRNYIRRVFYLKDYAKELRLNKEFSKDLHKEFDEVNDEIYKLNKKFGFKRFITNITASYISLSFMFDVIYILYLVIKASVFHSVSLAEVVVLYNSALNLRRGLSTIADIGPFTAETSLYIEKIRAFLNFENKIKNNKLSEMPENSGILECRNVSFGYDKENMILKDINITIKAKEKIALVGYNGAGKTTLIKLLLRLYDPTEGCILLNGIDIRQYDINEYRSYIGVIFQDFQLFAAEIGENVVMDKVNDSDEEKIITAIKMSGFYDRYKTLKNGLNTVLTNEFDNEGTDLSGGEAQKLAVARAFYKDAGLVLLDEPSSALDPAAEYNLNMSMNNMAKEKTVVFISHRLSTTRRADRIYLLDNGKISEQGTHEELLTLNGKYSEMWNAQALRYK